MPQNRVPVDVNISSAVEGIRNLSAIARELKELRAQGGRPIKDPTTQLREGATRTRAVFRELQRTLLTVFSGAAIAQFVRSSVQEFARAEAAFKGLQSTAEFTGVGVGRSFDAAAKLAADGLLTVQDASKALQNLLQRGFDLDDAIRVIERLKDSAAFGRQASLSLAEAVVSATEGIRNENSILVDNAGVTKNVSVLWQEYADEVGKTVAELTLAEKIQAEVNGILRETEGQVGNAAKASAGLQGQMARSSVEARKFQAALGQALAPALLNVTSVGRQFITGFLSPAITAIHVFGVRIARAVDRLKAFGQFATFQISADEFKRRIAEIEIIADETIARIRADAEEGPAPGQPAPRPGGADEPDPQRRAEFEARLQGGGSSRAGAASAKRLGSARLALARSEAQAELEIIREGLARQTREIENALEDRLISFREFARRRTELEQAGVDAEIRAVRERIAAEQRLPEGAKEADRIRAKAQVAQLEARLTVLNERRADVARQNAREAAQAERELRDALAGVRDELAELTGATTDEQRREALARGFRETRERLLAEGDQTGVELVDRLINVRVAEARFSELEATLSRGLERIRDQEALIQTRQSAGLLTEAQARERIIELQRQSADEIERALPGLEQAARALGPEAQARVAAWRAELEQARIVVDDFALRLQGAAGDAFFQFFDDLADRSKTLKESFLDLLRSVVSAIRRIIAQNLAESLAKSLFPTGRGAGGGGGGNALASLGSAFLRLFGGGGGAAGGGGTLSGGNLFAAEGGLVTGPGTATSDSIAANLSTGEFVVSADAVRRVGVGLLHAINGLKRGPGIRAGRLAFAAGGEVPAVAAGGAGGGLRIINVVDPELARDYLTSSAGEKVVLNTLSRNRDAVRQMLR